MGPFRGPFCSLFREQSLQALCLSQLSPTWEQELQPPASISVQPGCEVSQGSSVTFVCQGPAEVNTFRLETSHNSCNHVDLICERTCVDTSCELCHQEKQMCSVKIRMSFYFKNEANRSQQSSLGTEAQFTIEAVSKVSEGQYQCLYRKGGQWSARSKHLKLEVTSEDVSARPPGQSLKLEYIITGAMTALFLLLLLLGLLVYWHRKHGSHAGKVEEGRQHKSSILAGGILEKTPDLATVDSPQMPDRDKTLPTPDAEGLQEVTYAQLEHRTLTQRIPGAAPSQVADPTVESCTYAALARP